MFTLHFKPQVYDDIQIVHDWYEEQRIGLGEDFLLALEESYAKIRQTPKIYQVIYKHIRRNLVRKFPYGIFFIIEEDKIIVIAVLHTKRKPSDWITRI